MAKRQQGYVMECRRCGVAGSGTARRGRWGRAHAGRARPLPLFLAAPEPPTPHHPHPIP